MLFDGRTDGRTDSFSRMFAASFCALSFVSFNGQFFLSRAETTLIVPQAKIDYESRVAQEEMLKERTDAFVARMEKEEMELIQRLQNTQTVQRNAYEELEAALGSSSSQSKGGPAPKGGAGSSILLPHGTHHRGHTAKMIIL